MPDVGRGIFAGFFSFFSMDAPFLIGSAVGTPRLVPAGVLHRLLPPNSVYYDWYVKF